MTRVLADQPNVVAPDAEFPNGAVKNTVGASPGTDWTEPVTGDFIQFFQKLLIDASITANGNPDNVSNGYQLIDALVNKMTKNGVKRKSETTPDNTSMTSTEQDIFSFVFDASNDWDDLKISYSSTTSATSATGIFAITLQIYIDSVLQHAVAININDSTGGIDGTISMVVGGLSYTAGDVIQVTGKAGGSGTYDVGSTSVVVEGINV